MTRSLGELALALHHTWTENLVIELSQAELAVLGNDAAEPSFQIIDGKLEFRSLAIRNQLVAAEVAKPVCGRDGIALLEASSELLRYELTQSDHASEHLLMIAGKGGDLLSDGAEALIRATWLDIVNYDVRLRDNYDGRSTGVIVAVNWL